MYFLSFPGLGIEPFHIDKVAFTVFGRDVAWYGVLITCGMILAVIVAILLGKFEKVSADDITDLAFYTIIAGIIGARLYYVVFTWNEFYYLVTDGGFWHNLWGTFVNCIAIWNGGLAIYGGIIGGLIASLIFAKVKKISVWKIYDILIPCVLIGQIIGRWGNFINIEAYGADTTLPWRMGILYSASGAIPANGVWALEKYVHPTFLYESLWNLVGLVLVLIFYKKKKRNGQIFASYLIWYGFGRMLIEGLRTDSLMLGTLRVSQCVGLASCVIGIILHIVFAKTKVPAAVIETAETESDETKAEETNDGQTD